MIVNARRIVEAYRWQRGLGNTVVDVPFGRIVVNPDRPEVWDANHADAVVADSPDDIAALFDSMDRYLSHSPWRIVHTDPFTPDSFTARLALDGYVEQPATIQMVLDRKLDFLPGADVVAVVTEDDWAELAALVRRDHEEGARTGGKLLSAEMTDAIVAGYRAKGDRYQFHLARVNGRAVGYGAQAAAPSGAGMIEDLFTLPAYRRRGVASGLIAGFATALTDRGCSCVFLGALVGEEARHLYAKLGFQPVLLTRCWVRRMVDGDRSKRGSPTRK